MYLAGALHSSAGSVLLHMQEKVAHYPRNPFSDRLPVKKEKKDENALNKNFNMIFYQHRVFLMQQ